MKFLKKNDETFGERLLSLISQHFRSQSEFAERLGKPVQSINRIIKTDTASLDFLIEVVDLIPGVNLNWLLRGEGTMMINEIELPSSSKSSSQDTVNIPKQVLDIISSQQKTIENLSMGFTKRDAPPEGNAGCAAVG